MSGGLHRPEHIHNIFISTHNFHRHFQKYKMPRFFTPTCLPRYSNLKRNPLSDIALLVNSSQTFQTTFRRGATKMNHLVNNTWYLDLGYTCGDRDQTGRFRNFLKGGPMSQDLRNVWVHPGIMPGGGFRFPNHPPGLHGMRRPGGEQGDLYAAGYLNSRVNDPRYNRTFPRW